MGSFIEINDTLQITKEQGFPNDILNLEKHKKKPVTLDQVKDKIFEFRNKSCARIYHPGIRCFLVENINGKWLYWGKCLVVEQTIKTISKENITTSGKFKIIEVYNPEYQKAITQHECPEGLSYF